MIDNISEFIAGAILFGLFLWFALSCLDIAYNSLYQDWNLIKLMIGILKEI